MCKKKFLIFLSFFKIIRSSKIILKGQVKTSKKTPVKPKIAVQSYKDIKDAQKKLYLSQNHSDLELLHAAKKIELEKIIAENEITLKVKNDDVQHNINYYGGKVQELVEEMIAR